MTAELRAVLTAITDNAGLFQQMRAEISSDDLDDPLAKKIFTIMEECFKNETFSVGTILNRCDDPNIKDLIIQSVQEYSEHAEKSVLDSINLIKRNSLERKRLNLLNEIQSLQDSVLTEDREKLKDILSQKVDIDKQIALLKG